MDLPKEDVSSVRNHRWGSCDDQGNRPAGVVAVIGQWARACGHAWAAGTILALLCMFVVAPPLVPLVVPMSRYYELRSVTIANTTDGVSPSMIVDRTIHRPFRGRYEIVIMRAEGSQFVTWWECGSHESGWRPYRTDASLPERLDLDWWMGIPPNRECPLPPGKWKILTTVYARGPLGAELSATTESNVFQVGEASP